MSSEPPVLLPGGRGLEKGFSESSLDTVALPLAGDPLPPATSRSGVSDPSETPRPSPPTLFSTLCASPLLAARFVASLFSRGPPLPSPAQPSPLASPGSPCLINGKRLAPRPLFSSVLSLWGGSDYKQKQHRGAGPPASVTTPACSVEASPALSVSLTPGAEWAGLWPGGVEGVESPRGGGDDGAAGRGPADGDKPRSFFGAKNKPS
jgi:hypothetical protein